MNITRRVRVTRRLRAFGIALLLLLAAGICSTDLAADQNPPALKTESFDRDPGWEAHNNRIPPRLVKSVQQDFGYSATNIAGKDKGEIGGKVWRSSTRAYYAAKIPKKTLADKLSASGTFALTATAGSSGAFFGWFDSSLPGGGRQSNLGFHFAGAGAGARLTLRLVTALNQSCGVKVTQWEVIKKGEKIRPPSIKNDGTRYTWKLDYDPQAAGGDGEIHFTIRSNSASPEPYEGKTFAVPLPKGYKDQGTAFDRFGLMNNMKPGNPLTVHFDDIQLDGKPEDFSQDPGWEAVGNHDKYDNREDGGAHDFGFNATSTFAGGKPGEVGGMLWRSGAFSYYADRVGPLSLNDRLEASGKIILTVGPPDSGMYFGYFNSADKENAPAQTGNFVGVKIGGPTRVGHYFVPVYATTKTTPIERVGKANRPAKVAVEKSTGPVMVPQKVMEWRLVYDPAGAAGKGTIEATLGGESVTLALKPGDKEKGAVLDRFGLFTAHLGGHYIKVYLDDLKYTAAPAPR